MSGNAQVGACESCRFLFSTTTDAALLVDLRDGRILEANEAAASFLGYEHAELTRLSAEDLHPHEMEDFRVFARRVERERSCRTSELACRRKSGHLVPADIAAAAVVLDEREAMLTILRNLRRERLAEIGMGVAKIAHDLRNILASGRLLAERLEAVEDAATRRIAADLIATVDRASEMCAATLAAGRAEEPAPRLEPVDLRALVEIVAQTADLGRADGADWLNAVPEDLQATADRRQLYRALVNLARNAARVTPVDGLIAFEARAVPGGVELDLSDTGPGLPEALRDDPFVTFARSGSVGGSGLGLAIAHELMLNQGGRLELVETGPEGTRFRVTLPPG